MKIHTGKPTAYWQSHISAKNPIYQNSKAVRDMVLLLMDTQANTQADKR